MSRALFNSWIRQKKVKLLDKGYKTKCGIWQHSTNTPGYPQLRLGGEIVEGHRVMLETKLGRKLKSTEICMHKCNQKKCVNPAHLKVGTVSENTKAAYEDNLISKKK